MNIDRAINIQVCTSTIAWNKFIKAYFYLSVPLFKKDKADNSDEDFEGLKAKYRNIVLKWMRQERRAYENNKAPEPDYVIPEGEE